jgi:hypothetical protein
MLEALITSKTRLRLLIKFFVNIANKGYLNSLANEFGESTNSVRKELNNLSQAGYLNKEEINNKVIYTANIKHPMFSVLQKLVRKHLGIEQIVESIYTRIGEIKKVVIIGDYARGVDSGAIEILLVGENINTKFLDELTPKLKKAISRDIKFFISKSTISDKNSLVVFEAS